MDESVKVQADGDGDDDDDDGLESFLFIIFMTLYTNAALRLLSPSLASRRPTPTCTEGLHTDFTIVLFWLENPRPR